MSLLITSTIKTNEGIDITNSYGRVLVINDYQGNDLKSSLEVYSSKEAYEQSYSPLNINMSLSLTAPYDRTSEGSDTLDIAHNNMIAYLASMNISATKSL